jgi:hypothetical protein
MAMTATQRRARLQQLISLLSQLSHVDKAQLLSKLSAEGPSGGIDLRTMQQWAREARHSPLRQRSAT